MDCYFPGRVLVGPGPEAGGPSGLAQRLSKEFSGDFELEFSFEDVLAHNGIETSDHSRRSLPFVGRVPEGAEIDFASRLRRLPRWQVAAATPDYLVRPNAPLTVDQAALDQIISRIGARPGGAFCGNNTIVGILDSGVDPTYVQSPPLHPKQYNALSPSSAGFVPSDPIGHGSLVARIVNAVAPGAKLISVKTFDQDGTISSVLAAMYVAQGAGPCDILNLSLKVSCDPALCAVCQTPGPTSTNISQLSYFFDTFMHMEPNVILVAAAGNNSSHLTLPAAIDRVIAVGSFDYDRDTPISAYRQVPASRFVLAPGGNNASGKAFASRSSFAGRTEFLHGTSFAAAFVTGFAAKTICNLRNRACGTPRRSSPVAGLGSGILAAIVGEIDACADKSWAGFDPALHGLGAIRF
jgi:hypothetical protein